MTIPIGVPFRRGTICRANAVPKSQLDYDVNRRYVIERVISRGTLEDLRTAFSYYGKETIIDIATSLRTLEPAALSFISCVTSTPREKFRCYTPKPSCRAPWIY